MDSGKKPEKKNPRKGANPLSQLFFAWIIPLFWHGTRHGLNTEDLTKCLRKDKSDTLGNALEAEWAREVRIAQKKQRKPRLRNAMFRVYAPSFILDGLLVLMYILLKSLLPLVLAQLLIQFQKPIVVEHALAVNGSRPLINDTLSTSPLSNDSIVHRSTRALGGQLSFDESDNSIRSANLFAPDYSIDGNRNTLGQLNIVDDVKNESIRNLYPQASPKSDKHDELMLNLTRQDVYEYIDYMWNDVHWLAALMMAMIFTGCLLTHHSDLRMRMYGAQMRIACCSMIYRKGLRLSALSANKTGSGYLVNLLSNDVSRLDVGFVFAHFMWILPIQSILICYLIWLRVGWVAVIGVVSLLIKTVPVQTRLSRISSMLRMRVAVRTDDRVGIMNEIIQGIQVIKMYAWERPFQRVVCEARRLEVKQIRYASYIRGVYVSTAVFIERSTLFIAIAACIMLGHSVTADIVYSMAQYFNVLQLNAAIVYPMALSLGAEALVSIRRIEEFLLKDEKSETDVGIERRGSGVLMDKKKNSIEIRNVSASWEEDEPNRKTLQNIVLDVKQGQLCAIIGPVGGGKSSLMQLLLGELPIQSGTVSIQGSMSYASQKPWLFTGTVRNNILFGQIYDKRRYNEVVKCCALSTDFEQFPNGDKTIVGERGASLSGGQRARISLARAVYKAASIYLLDDPLSAVDAHVGKHLFEEVIGPKGRLAQNATRILITHQVHFLKEADVIVIIENGRVTHQGTYAELSNTDLDFAKLLQKIEEEEEKLELNDNGELYEEDDIPYMDGVSSNGSGYRAMKSRTDSISKSIGGSSLDLKDDEIEAEEQSDSKLPLRAIKQYFLAGANWWALLCLVLVMIVSQCVTSGSDYYVNFWTQQEYRRIHGEPVALTERHYLYIYAAIILAVIFVCLLRAYLFFKICMRSSKVLHDKMFESILHAPMRFFDLNPSGRILNRFSKDMGAIDEMLPRLMMDSIQISLVMVGILVMVLIVNPIMIAALACAIVLFIGVIKLYMRPAQDLKRLESIARSPVFSHLTATISGLPTIRARNIQQELVDEFDGLQDVHSAVWQLAISSNTACGLWLDVISTAFTACVTFSFIILYENTFSGNVGLAISQSLILTGMVQYGVRQVAESLQQMTSVERILQYTDLEPEFSPPDKPPADWPRTGKVSFQNMSLRYDPKGPPTLKNLRIEIQAGWKVGVVGRTGAGKSSLISALFRLSHIDGIIEIDNINTALITLESLRSKVSIIPQDPVLFSESVRYNLDPFGLYSDDQMWCALDDVELKGSIESLDYRVTEGGANFSVGQRQLICLARAILRNNKVLVLDEATANVDPQTDALIQKTIRDTFQKYTVITVAHRLHTVMDSDRILVMEAGSAKEFDAPHILLETENGIFKSMVEATGAQECESLKKIAEQKYNESTVRTIAANGKVSS